MAEGGVETIRFHLEFLHHVGVRCERGIPALAILRLPVQVHSLPPILPAAK